MNWTKIISTLTAGLVLLLALMAFALSYASLQHLAASNGVGSWLAYVWPLLLDFAMVVFSLAILRASLRGERAVYAWTLTLTFGALATAANVFDVTTFGLPPVYVQVAVKALPPVALILAFELLMSMVKADVKQAGAVQTLAELNATLNAGRAELERLTAAVDARQAELERLRAEQVGKAEPVQDAKSSDLAVLNGQKVADKQEAMAALLAFYRSNPLASLSEAGQAIERSKATVSNYLSELEQAGTVHRNGNGVEVLR